MRTLPHPSSTIAENARDVNCGLTFVDEIIRVVDDRLGRDRPEGKSQSNAA